MRKHEQNRNTEVFRSPGAERRYRNKQREMEKQQRRQPVGRRDWEEK